MFRVLSILAAVAALAVTAAPASAARDNNPFTVDAALAAPVASAGTSKKPPVRGTARTYFEDAVRDNDVSDAEYWRLSAARPPRQR
jgi:hypothetical protein